MQRQREYRRWRDPRSRGVYRNTRNTRWVVRITHKGKTYYAGSHRDLGEAKRIRDRFYATLYGPDWAELLPVHRYATRSTE